MSSRVLGLFCCVTLVVGTVAGCSMLIPGNEGWECKTSKDCKENLRCRTYKFKGKDRTKRFCTGKKRLAGTNQTYGWFLLIAAWVMILALPVLVVVLVIVVRIRKRKEGQQQPSGSPPAAGGQQPPGTPQPPADGPPA